MADLKVIAQTNEIALTTATEKTVLQIVAPANHRLVVKEWGVFFDGVSVTAEAVVVKLERQTTAGTMSALTLVKVDDSVGETIQSTAQHTATVEPTSGDLLEQKNIHPQAGYEKIYPLGDEIKVGGGDRLGITCTAPAGVNVIAYIKFEE
jgi:hypothetical protein